MKLWKNKCVASVLCMVLIVAMALSMTACGSNSSQPADEGGTQTQTAEKTFAFEVTDKDGHTETFSVTTHRETVGQALLEEGLIAGEDGPYGLYVTEVNGITADFAETGAYWAFYVNGAYASGGVDKTPVTDGSTYGFKVEK